VVIDARLKGNHTANGLQMVLMAVCKVEVPFRISQLLEFQYLSLLPHEGDRPAFIDKYGSELHTFGYVTYHWSPLKNGSILTLKYKVWIQLDMQINTSWMEYK
jgi:hypothetical protein